ncbi:Anaphase promoting complex subunit 7, variant 2 [Chamberlinius hualienensis]
MKMTVFEQIKLLYTQKLYSNVTCLANMMLSISQHSRDFMMPMERLQLLIWYADSLYELLEYRKAEVYYQEALAYKKALIKSKDKGQINSADLPSDIDIKYSIYLCHMSMKQYSLAISVLEGISGKHRTAKVSMALAKLYQQSGSERSAITAYKEILREFPLALDAAIGLLSLGVRSDEVAALMLNSVSGITNMDWLSTWIKAHSSLYSRDHPQAINLFNILDTKPGLRGNAEILSSLGEAHYLNGDYKLSLIVLRRAHINDPLLCKGMDIYSTLLVKEKQIKDLEQLATQLMETSDNCAEAWIAFGNFTLISKSASKALYYAQKACSIDPRSVEAFLLKGKIMLDTKKMVDATEAYREAFRISPYSFEAHQGLVKIYLSQHRNRDAETIAKNACMQLGQTSRTLLLYASVLAADPGSVDKAEAYLERALKLDPTNVEVVYQLAEICQQERRYEKGIDLLLKHAELHSTSHLHRLLAEFYNQVNNSDKALEHFSAAINLDSRNQLAIEGFQNVEHKMEASGSNFGFGLDAVDSENEVSEKPIGTDGLLQTMLVF